MKKLILGLTALSLTFAPAFAQDQHRDDHPANNNNMMMNHHDDHSQNSMMMMQGHHSWHKGDHIGADDWNRGVRISNYRHYHLSRPPRGYEWRRVDDNYVLAAVAGGIIASVIAASH